MFQESFLVNSPVTLTLSVEELTDLFNRCLSSPLEDTDVSVEAMRKLGEALSAAPPKLRLAS
jgi:hypothetical protein